jgi:anti-sigma regulatory factor (Ser/Thr protein kinase)
MNTTHRAESADGVFRTVAATARAARDFVTATLLTGEELQTVETVRLIVSELVSNALQHDAESAVSVELRHHGAHAIHVEVCGGRVEPASLGDPADWQVAPPDDPAGRGLGIVAALAHDITVDTDDGVLIVRCHVSR